MLRTIFWRSGHEPDQRSEEEDDEFEKWVRGIEHPGVDVPWVDMGECDVGFAAGEFLKNMCMGWVELVLI
jgi:hypothetical protein